MAGRSIISMPPGMMPAPMILATHSPPSSDAVKPISAARALCGFLRMRTVTSVTTPKSPSEPGEDAERVVPAGIVMLAAEPQNFAGHQDQLAAEHIVGGHAVFEAMYAAGILRHIAADTAGDLRRRIGRVIETGLLDCLRNGEIGNAGLDHGDAVVEIDLANAIEFRES